MREFENGVACWRMRRWPPDFHNGFYGRLATQNPNGSWFVTEDHRREDDGGVWAYENIDADEARAVALEVPDPSASDMSRLTRPESSFTLDQIDRHPVDKLLGKRFAEELAVRSRRNRSVSGK
ncbi:hypothetical protein ACFFX1_11715 [Dactylosporangium sucinum]|nr:hypothetical protein [Dactylosporangium sucinum]